MGFVGFKLVEQEKQRKRNRYQTVSHVIFFLFENRDQTLYRIDINNVVVIVNHEP